MGRYRPPIPPASPYITPQGYAALDQELKQLWQRRAQVTQALSAAAAEGDRSENAEYIYRKKELREIDRRIRYLQKRLPVLKVVAEAPADPQRVFFGAWVSLEDPQGQGMSFRIVGADEMDHDSRYISMDSPMARALLRRQCDEDILVQTPGGPREFRIIAIEYTHGTPTENQ